MFQIVWPPWTMSNLNQTQFFKTTTTNHPSFSYDLSLLSRFLHNENTCNSHSFSTTCASSIEAALLLEESHIFLAPKHSHRAHGKRCGLDSASMNTVTDVLEYGFTDFTDIDGRSFVMQLATSNTALLSICVPCSLLIFLNDCFFKKQHSTNIAKLFSWCYAETKNSIKMLILLFLDGSCKFPLMWGWDLIPLRLKRAFQRLKCSCISLSDQVTGTTAYESHIPSILSPQKWAQIHEPSKCP